LPPLVSAPTAKTLNERVVCVEPQLGHFAFVPSAPLMFRTSRSNLASHDLQTYS
jgi:hypothetical protein